MLLVFQCVSIRGRATLWGMSESLAAVDFAVSKEPGKSPAFGVPESPGAVDASVCKDAGAAVLCDWDS